MPAELHIALELKRTNSTSADFRELVQGLDKELWTIYPQIQGSYTGYNKVENLETTLVAYADGKPVGCGCFKKMDPRTVEIKRIFVLKDKRGKGVAGAIMQGLEGWAKDLNYTTAILEVGKLQPDAIHVYKKSGYSVIPNYPPYIGMEYSVCMKKEL